MWNKDVDTEEAELQFNGYGLNGLIFLCIFTQENYQLWRDIKTY